MYAVLVIEAFSATVKFGRDGVFPDLPIQENLWWAIPEKLAGERKPTLEEILELQIAGVGAIVSVMDDPSNLALYQKARLPHLWLPTKGATAPSNEQIQQLQSFVDEQNQLGHAVAVHCTSGKRRNGTMLAAHLIQIGSTFEDALQTVLATNPDVELREAQVDFLRTLANESMQLISHHQREISCCFVNSFHQLSSGTSRRGAPH